MKNIDWKTVRRVLVIRLRSIGDTVLATPTLTVLRRFLPNAEIDILLEDWVAPLLDGFGEIDNVISVGRDGRSRARTAIQLRRRSYDVVFDLHGGTTGTFFAAASGARYKVGYSHYRYSFLYNVVLSSSAEFWRRTVTHSAEQQLALVGFTGIPVADRPRTGLTVMPNALAAVNDKISAKSGGSPPKEFALLHPAAAFATKLWPEANFARIADFLGERGIATIAVAARSESEVLAKTSAAANVPILSFDGLSLPEITALASEAKLFVGNDSGIAHIAAAVGTPTVVIFGSSNRDHWRPWTDAPNEIVFEDLPCQPCPGFECKVFGNPKCILSVHPEQVKVAIETVLTE